MNYDYAGTSHASHVAFYSDLRMAIRGGEVPGGTSTSIKAPEGAKGGKAAVEIFPFHRA